MKHTLSIAAIGLCLAFAGCFSKASAVKPVGDELPQHELEQLIAGSGIGP